MHICVFVPSLGLRPRQVHVTNFTLKILTNRLRQIKVEGSVEGKVEDVTVMDQMCRWRFNGATRYYAFRVVSIWTTIGR